MTNTKPKAKTGIKRGTILSSNWMEKKLKPLIDKLITQGCTHEDLNSFIIDLETLIRTYYSSKNSFATSLNPFASLILYNLLFLHGYDNNVYYLLSVMRWLHTKYKKDSLKLLYISRFFSASIDPQHKHVYRMLKKAKKEGLIYNPTQKTWSITEKGQRYLNRVTGLYSRELKRLQNEVNILDI